MHKTKHCKGKAQCNGSLNIIDRDASWPMTGNKDLIGNNKMIFYDNSEGYCIFKNFIKVTFIFWFSILCQNLYWNQQVWKFMMGEYSDCSLLILPFHENQTYTTGMYCLLNPILKHTRLFASTYDKVKWSFLDKWTALLPHYLKIICWAELILKRGTLSMQNLYVLASSNMHLFNTIQYYCTVVLSELWRVSSFHY